jgi:hypothetical protein
MIMLEPDGAGTPLIRHHEQFADERRVRQAENHIA